MHEKLAGREIIVEIHQIGTYARVTAMDTATLTEATITGPANAPEHVLRGNALRKLAFLLKKNGIIKD